MQSITIRKACPAGAMGLGKTTVCQALKQALDTIKIDTTEKSVEDTVQCILTL